MNNLKTFFPNVVLTGAGAIKEIPYWIDHFNGNRVLLVTDLNIYKLGFANKIKDIVSAGSINLVIWDGVIANPDLATVKKGLDALNKNNCDFIIGLGGGSVLDAAKAISVSATNGGDVRKCLGLYRITKRGLPMILIPTTSGTGSEATQASILVDEVNNTKVAIYSEYNMADVVILDYELTYDLPPKVTADTGIDALCHAIEAYVSKGSSDFTDLMSLSSIENAGKYLIRAFRNGKNDKEAREGMADSAFYAGMGFCGAGLGGAHGLAYPLIEYNLLHGRSVGVFLPWVIEYNLSCAEEKFSNIALALDKSCASLSVREAAKKSIDIVKGILTSLDISYKLSDYGVAKDKLSSMAEIAVNSTKRLLKFNPKHISVEDGQEIYIKAY
ncbi:MAG: iron-containing alcohol dehydrogenase [Actinobacteria bacterium]|nr:iron-containing alcohol dehydrogenase [Actinomycetota bacterium]